MEDVQKTTPPPVNDPQPSTANTPPIPPLNPPGPNPTDPIKKPFSKSKMIIILAVLVILSGVAFAAWYFQSQLQKTTTEVTTQRTQAASTPEKTLIIGTDPTYPPMEFMEGDVLVGYDIDLANFLGKELETKIQIKNIEFDSLFTSLEQSDIDMIISGVTITEERKQKYDFSQAYLNAGQVIITKKTNDTIHTTADLKGKRISVQKGTTNETEAMKYTDALFVMKYENFEEATKSLVEDKSDAIFTDLPNAKGITVDNPSLRIASDPFTNENYGIVFRKGDPTMKQVNTALKALKIKRLFH